MNYIQRRKLQKRAVTFTAAALFCSIILFAGIFTAFVRIHNRINYTPLSLPILQKTDEGQAQFSVLTYSKNIDIESLSNIGDKNGVFLILLPDDSSIIFSFFDIIYDYISN